MGEGFVITSGKGGVGKTTSTANIGAGLAAADQKTILNRYRYWLKKSGCDHGTWKTGLFIIW